MFAFCYHNVNKISNCSQPLLKKIASSTDDEVKVKSPPTGHPGPEGSRRVKAPSFRDMGTLMVVGCQPYAPAAFTHRSIPDDRKHTWYSFLLEAESTPGPYCDRQDYVMEKNPDTEPATCRFVA